MNRPRRRSGVLLVAALSVVAMGCSSGKSDSASTSQGKATSGAAVADVAGGSQSPTQLGAVEPTQRKQVRTGEMALAASSADEVARVADETIVITTESGGQVDGDRRSGGETPTADLVLRVPPDALDATVDRIAGLAKVTSRSVQTEDVTSQYTDLEGRIAALQTSTERLRGFLAAATDANQIASIEGELTRRESDLESLQGQLRVLSAKTDLATLKVAVRTEQSVATASAPGPVKALSAGWDTFRLVVGWTLAIVLAAAPFLVVLALLLLARRAWRRRHPRAGAGRSMRPPPPVPPPAPIQPDPMSGVK